MKVYSVPTEVPVPEVDYSNFNYAKMLKDEEDHQERLKQWLIANGFTGKYTGEIVRFPVADGCATYMLADVPRRSVLVHLPYGDAYEYPYVEHIPKKDIVERIKMQKASTFFMKKQ